MKKGIAVLLVLVMSMGAIAASFGSTGPIGTEDVPSLGEQVDRSNRSDVVTMDVEQDDPVIDYFRSLDGSRPTLPGGAQSGEPLKEAESHRGNLLVDTDAVFLYEDPVNVGKWLPLPTQYDITSGKMDPASFSNGTSLEVHGKLFDSIVDENMTYLDDIGIPMVPIEVEFDGVPVALNPDYTGNGTASIDPFRGNGNGTFEFRVDLIRPAGQYELILHFAGWPPVDPVYATLTYRTQIYVSHPTILDLDVSPDAVSVGNDINISGRVADDTGRSITSIPLQIWFDEELIGPASDGIYIDDVRVGGTFYSEDFDSGNKDGWTTYSTPGSPAGDQWELGPPLNGFGPTAPHSSSGLWGTNLNGNYQRGAWSFLVSPSLDLTALHSYNLTFWAWWNVYWEDDMAYVLASDDGGVTWNEDDAMTFMGSTLSHEYWTQYEFDATMYQGSDQVRFAFVFYSADKTLDVRTDATFEYIHRVSTTTEAGLHNVTIVFVGSLLFQTTEVYEDVMAKQTTMFEFISGANGKIGYRNKGIPIRAKLVDGTGAVVKSNIGGESQTYKVQVYWDPTWTINDGKGEAVGPPVAVDGRTGEINISYQVSWNHILGPAKVTFEFLGTNYYSAVEQGDVYYVKAETYFLPSPVQNRTMYRGRSAEIQVDLRIVIAQSIDKLEPGDPLAGEFVKIFWNGQIMGNRRTDYTGQCRIDYLVPSIHDLGVINITFVYEGQTLYDSVAMSFNYTVISETSIAFEDSVVEKGTWIWMNGTIIDDKGQGISGIKIGLSWRGGAEVATTTAGGSFSHHYYIEFEDKVGNVSVTARFGGNTLYQESARSAIYSFTVRTILERRDNTITAIRGESIVLNGKLYEDWGGQKGIEVQRETITLIIDEIVVVYKRTAFDGSVTFTAPIEPDKFNYGEVDLVFSFEGTEFYHSAVNITPLVIQANSQLTFSEFRVSGELFDNLYDIVLKNEETYGRVLLQDDNFQPLTFENVSVFYKDAGLRARKRLVQIGMTDGQGYIEFNWTFQDNAVGVKAFIVEYAGKIMSTTINGADLVILPSVTQYNLTYDVPNVDPREYEVDTDGDKLVEPGMNLALLVVVKDPGDWNLEDINFSLVDPPEGMTITSDGVILWTPDEEDKGIHTIKVRIEDGERTETATIVISVAEESGSKDEMTNMILLLAAGSVIAIVVVVLVFIRTPTKDRRT